MEGDLPVAEVESIGDPTVLNRFMANQRRMAESRGLSEVEYWEAVLERIEENTGPLHSWQRFYAIAALSGRGVEWAETRARPHYHIMGLPCPICGRV